MRELYLVDESVVLKEVKFSSILVHVCVNKECVDKFI